MIAGEPGQVGPLADHWWAWLIAAGNATEESPLNVTIAMARTCLPLLPIWLLACSARLSGESEPPAVSPALPEAPDRNIREGSPIPSFDLPLLGEAEKRISNTTFAGEVVLLELWASSCAVCVEEIAGLHAVHERYAPRGLSIVSINLFESAEKVRAFRRDRWPMPWHHVVVEDEAESDQVARTLEATSLPTSILIDRNGRVAATGAAARGAALEETLARLLSADRW